jgi:predicted DNA-binding protein
MAKKPNILAVNVPAELHARLEAVAEKTGLPKNAIARFAVEAAVKAAEEHGYKIVLPMEFEVASIPVSRKTAQGDDLALAAEDPGKYHAPPRRQGAA